MWDQGTFSHTCKTSIADSALQVYDSDFDLDTLSSEDANFSGFERSLAPQTRNNLSFDLDSLPSEDADFSGFERNSTHSCQSSSDKQEIFQPVKASLNVPMEGCQATKKVSFAGDVRILTSPTQPVPIGVTSGQSPEPTAHLWNPRAVSSPVRRLAHEYEKLEQNTLLSSVIDNLQRQEDELDKIEQSFKEVEQSLLADLVEVDRVVGLAPVTTCADSPGLAGTCSSGASCMPHAVTTAASLPISTNVHPRLRGSPTAGAYADFGSSMHYNALSTGATGSPGGLTPTEALTCTTSSSLVDFNSDLSNACKVDYSTTSLEFQTSVVASGQTTPLCSVCCSGW